MKNNQILLEFQTIILANGKGSLSRTNNLNKTTRTK